jgi:hypothetical protein
MSNVEIVNWGPTAVNVAAVLVAAGIAVWGTIRGAREGAKHGAEATLAATQQAIDAQRAAVQSTEEQQRNAVRLLLSLEIDHNLARVQAFWSHIWSIALPEDIRSEEDPEWKRQSEQRFRARLVARSPVLVFSQRVWNGQTSVLGSAIRAEEIRRTNRIYGQLDTLSGIQAQLAVMDAEQARHTTTGWRRLGEEGLPTAAVTFNEVAPSLWVETEEIVAELLANGNPISEDANRATTRSPE